MNEDKFLKTLGMAMRAGKVLSGDETVLRHIRSGKYIQVVVAADASANTIKKFQDKGSFYDIEVLVVSSREKLGNAIGKGDRVVLGITDIGFANQIRKYTGVIE